MPTDCDMIVIERHSRVHDRWVVVCCGDHETLGRAWLSPEYAKEDMEREHGPGLVWTGDDEEWSAPTVRELY